MPNIESLDQQFNEFTSSSFIFYSQQDLKLLLSIKLLFS
jgi:hypothetical protein